MFSHLIDPLSQPEEFSNSRFFWTLSGNGILDSFDQNHGQSGRGETGPR